MLGLWENSDQNVNRIVQQPNKSNKYHAIPNITLENNKSTNNQRLILMFWTFGIEKC